MGLGFSLDGFNNMSCGGQINMSGYYKMNSSSANLLNITSDTGVSCINITTSNVYLDLNGTWITGSTVDLEAAIYVYNLTGTGLLDNITIANGFINNSYFGISVKEAKNVTISNVSISNTTTAIYIYDCSRVLVNESRFTNNHNSALWFYSGFNNTIKSNYIQGNYTAGGTQGLIYLQSVLTQTANYSIMHNTITFNNSGSTGPGIRINVAGAGINLSYNNISNSTVASAIRLLDANVSKFEGNNINNVSKGIYLQGGSELTFSLGNTFNQTLPGGVLFNISNGTVATNSYDITTEYMPFAFTRAMNVSIQVVNLTAYPGTSVSLPGVVTTGATTTAKAVQTIWGNYYGLNVTVENPGNSISLTLYYNTSDISGSYSTSRLGIGNSSVGNTWGYRAATVSGSSVTVSGITSTNGSGTTSFGYLALIAYYFTYPTVPSGSSAITYITPTTSFDCKTGVLTVTLSSSVNGGTVKLLDKTNFQAPVIAKVEDGKAVFTISKSGTYKIVEESFSSDYDLNDKTETYTLCAEGSEEPQVECTTNLDCSSTEQCTANECVTVTGTCGYAASNAWVSYECCADPDCASGTVCTNNVCTSAAGVPDFVDAVLVQAAIDAINEATSAIETAKGEGKDTVDAEAKLAEAQAAFDSGDSDLAESLARESIELIKEPQAEETTEEETPEEVTEEPTDEKKGADYSLVLYLVGAVIVLFLLYKFVLKGGKGYRK